MPLPEEQVHSNIDIFTNPGNQMEAVISLTVTDDNAVIFYDHWENGYEATLTNPSQATTEVWGDGNDANGKPPDYVSDFLNSDDIVTL